MFPRLRREPRRRRAPAGQPPLPCSASLTGETGWAAQGLLLRTASRWPCVDLPCAWAARTRLARC
jgi:hypothetical protein